MTLDTEQDRELLLSLIAKAQIAGAAVFVVGDLIQRIQKAAVATAGTEAPTSSDT